MNQVNRFEWIGWTKIIIEALEKKKIEYLGKNDIHQKECHEFALSLPHIKSKFHIYIDENSCLVYASFNDRASNRYTVYSNYKNVNGLLIPHLITRYDASESVSNPKLIEQFKTDSVVLNIRIPDSSFEF